MMKSRIENNYQITVDIFSTFICQSTGWDLISSSFVFNLLNKNGVSRICPLTPMSTLSIQERIDTKC